MAAKSWAVASSGAVHSTTTDAVFELFSSSINTSQEQMEPQERGHYTTDGGRMLVGGKESGA
ncbi:hypothetical protein RCEC007_880005 [Escherichia coli]|nr:hypothetical protein RCEC007_880005 [Escherichia coli]